MLGGPVPIRERIIGEHLHAESAQDLGNDAPDLAGAHDAGGLAVQVEADQAIEREVELAHTVEGAVDLAVESQQQRDGMLGHRVRRIDRDTRDGKVQRLGGGDTMKARNQRRIRLACLPHLQPSNDDGFGEARYDSGDPNAQPEDEDCHGDFAEGDTALAGDLLAFHRDRMLRGEQLEGPELLQKRACLRKHVPHAAKEREEPLSLPMEA